MKKRLAMLLSFVLVLGLLSACGNNNEDNEAAPSAEPEAAQSPSPSSADAAAGNWEDGAYYAEGAFDDHSGWKEIVALKVEGGSITDVNWNGVHKDGGLDKKSYSEQGKYGMVAKGGAQAEWHEQAAKAEQFLLDKQDPQAIVVDAEGYTDAISGVSIGVDGFTKLVNDALAAGPVQPGPYKDGTYHAEEPEFAENGWKYFVDITVMNGHIVAANWNGVHKDGGDDKKTQSANGQYGMVAKGGAQAEWHEQAYLAEQHLIQTQDPAAITYTDDQGHTDAISGVSIHVVEFFSMAEEALAQAK